MRQIYSLVFYLLTPVVLLRLWWRGFKSPAYRQRIPERFAHVSLSTERPVLWLHAVSVGETMAAAPLIDSLQKEYPDHTLLLTTTTPTGSAQVRRLYPTGDSIEHCYFPYDLPHVVKRFLDRVQPDLLIIMETELWPNLYHHCEARNVPILLANARLSKTSLKGYRKISWLIAPTLQKLAYLAAQSELDLERFLSLGARSQSSGNCGNLKYQVKVSAEMQSLAKSLEGSLKERKVWIAASTHAGEDEIVLNVHRQLLKQQPSAILILVPRHPERFDDVAALCNAASMGVARRSRDESPVASQAVWLIDTMGELMAMYALADFSFIGGSLVATGGHNPLEPAAFSVASIIGPHTFNFTDVVQTMDAANAIKQVADVAELTKAVNDWMATPVIHQEIGEAARQVLEDNLGAVPCLLDKVSRLVKSV